MRHQFIPLTVLLFAFCVDFINSESIYAWGDNGFGQLGLGTNGSATVRSPTPIATYKSLDISSISLARSFHFAVTNDFQVYTTGNNYYEALGLGSNSPPTVYTPIQHMALSNFRNCKIFPGLRHTNAICNSTLYGWGEAAGNVLTGISSGNYPNVRKTTAKFTDIATVVATAGGTFVTLVNGSTYVAGINNTHGQLGIGTTTNQLSFKRVDVLSDNNMQVFPSHAAHICAIHANFSIYCWGLNDDGQLGLGDFSDRLSPTRIAVFDDNQDIIAQVATGEAHTIALSCSGKVYTWGSTLFGALGNNEYLDASYNLPIHLETLDTAKIVEIRAGARFNYARTENNQWYTWGAGFGGVLGTNSDLDVLTPTLSSQLDGLGINHVEISSVSNGVIGWPKSGVTNVRATHCPTPINECLTPADTNCAYSNNAACLDTDRGYKCVCLPGYQGDPTTNCVDINECLNDTVLCDQNATCINSPGSFSCQCQNGYHGNGVSTALGGEGCLLDVNECLKDPCNGNTICEDTVWSYNCSCKNGYAATGKNGTGVICTDINECSRGTSNCSPNATCTNLQGSFNCSCFGGFAGDGIVCEDVNECTNGIANCSVNATCTNKSPGFSCVCKPGLFGNGFSCSDTPPISTGTTGAQTSAGSTTQTSSSTTPSGSTTQAASSTQTTSPAGSTTQAASTQSAATTQAASTQTTFADSTGFPSGFNTLGGVIFESSDDIQAPQTTNNYVRGSDNGDDNKKDVHILIGVFVGVVGIIIILIIVFYVVAKRKESSQSQYI